ncbi:MAG: methyl-accepting chemotaxis protein [Fibrobacterota bacterium]
MYTRETNRRLLALFILCAAAAVFTVWTVREKFVDPPWAALLLGLLAAGFIGWAFTRYLEFRLNSSADAVISRVRKMAEGDLTQRFKEDAEDALPYGLSLELGRLAAFYRENVGGLWKVSARLSRQLAQFLETAGALGNEFLEETEALGKVGGQLEAVRQEVGGITKKVSDLRVNSSNDAQYLRQIDAISSRALDELKAHRGIIKNVLADLQGIATLEEDMHTGLAEFQAIANRSAEVEKAVADLSVETGLVKLNASIDAVQAQASEGAYRKILDEMRLLGEKFDALRPSGGGAAASDARIGDIGQRLETCGERLRKGISDTEMAGAFFSRVSEHYLVVAVSYESVFENVKRLSALMEEVDGRTVEFTGSIKAAAEGFDKLRADTQITLLHFHQLDERAQAIRESLKELDQFKNLFRIA